MSFSIGIAHGKNGDNFGSLCRAAWQLGAEGVFTIGARFPIKRYEATDTYKSVRHIRHRHYRDVFELVNGAMPLYGAHVVGIEIGGESLTTFVHPEDSVYLLGGEDCGLTEAELGVCDRVVSIASVRQQSYNVAVAGAIVMHDRMTKMGSMT